MGQQTRERARYRVGAAAEAAGVRTQTLHYYERRGLVRAPRRTPSGYREYGPEDIRRVRAVKRAQSLGFTLREIREMIRIAEDRRTASRVVALAEAKLEEIDGKIRDLRRMRRALAEAAETCRCRGDLSRCDVLAGLAEEPRA